MPAALATSSVAPSTTGPPLLSYGWQTVPEIAKGMVQSGRRDKRGRVDAPEVLIVNGPPAEARTIRPAAPPSSPSAPAGLFDSLPTPEEV